MPAGVYPGSPDESTGEKPGHDRRENPPRRDRRRNFFGGTSRDYRIAASRLCDQGPVHCPLSTAEPCKRPTVPDHAVAVTIAVSYTVSVWHPDEGATRCD